MSKNRVWVAGRLNSIVCSGSTVRDPPKPNIHIWLYLNGRKAMYLNPGKKEKPEENAEPVGLTASVEKARWMFCPNEVEGRPRLDSRKVLIYCQPSNPNISVSFTAYFLGYSFSALWAEPRYGYSYPSDHL